MMSMRHLDGIRNQIGVNWVDPPIYGVKGGATLTKRRDWPNTAAWARDEAAEHLIEAIHALNPLVTGERLDSFEVLKRQAIALAAAQNALLCLERVGAKTRGGDR